MSHNLKTKTSAEEYQQRHKEGYGLRYPDGHIIRAYEQVIRKHFDDKISERSLLDFGCWNGTHTKYFSDKGFDIYGVDIVEGALEEARSINPDYQDNFFKIDDNSNLNNVLSQKFDVIFSNQVLYFLTPTTFEKRLREFDSLLKQGGIILATMMARDSYWSMYSKGIQQNGLEEIDLSNHKRLKGKHYVRFIESKEHLSSVFYVFKTLKIGYYSSTIDVNEGIGSHYIFIGAKR
ncbi:class I SAM-dependent methyltransferase [Minwuia thermotolerans]|uniref:Methyltransferase n=1 Tax=Minwuia thermotolerans TaxID=2056226 RepID=A0A2M9G6A8_9PROT|nr:class I SAM-dependent methyltransferase [Minwuia thermotolerans]PJK31206.1 methyltransferase [Minwuia thermotolerans]